MPSGGGVATMICRSFSSNNTHLIVSYHVDISVRILFILYMLGKYWVLIKIHWCLNFLLCID